MEENKKNPEELGVEKDKSSNAIISLPEKIIFIAISVVADALEIFAFLTIGIPAVGFGLWLMSYFFGIFVSAAIFVWSMFRGVNGSFFVKKLLILGIGFLVDEAMLGVLPIRTLTLVVTIWLNNHIEQEKLTVILRLLKPYA